MAPQNQQSQVMIDPEGDYAVKGSVIISIVQGLKHTIPIEYLNAVVAVENLLASAARVNLQEKPADNVQEV